MTVNEKDALGENRAKYCVYCGKRYITIRGLQSHMRAFHSKTLEQFKDTKESY